jgi:hypothetical protein
MHVVMKADFLPIWILRDMWLQATGDSHVIRIEQARVGNAGWSYAGKYAAKGFDSSLAGHPDALAVCLDALRSVRLFGTYGAWRGFKLASRSGDPGEFDTLCRLDDAVDGASRGERWALELLAGLPGKQGERVMQCDRDTLEVLLSAAIMAGD